jgi:hypothetical protein
MPTTNSPTISAAELEVIPATRFVAFMRSRPARFAVWTASALASSAALAVGYQAAMAGSVPLAAVFGALTIPLSAGVLRIGEDLRRSGDLFPANRFYLRDRGAQLGTGTLSLVFGALFGMAAQAGINADEKTKAEQALKATTPELARDTLVPAAQLCGDKTSGYVYTLHEGKKHRVSCVPK